MGQDRAWSSGRQKAAEEPGRARTHVRLRLRRVSGAGAVAAVVGRVPAVGGYEALEEKSGGTDQ